MKMGLTEARNRVELERRLAAAWFRTITTGATWEDRERSKSAWLSKQMDVLAAEADLADAEQGSVVGGLLKLAILVILIGVALILVLK